MLKDGLKYAALGYLPCSTLWRIDEKTDYSSKCRTGKLHRGTVNHRHIFTVDRADRELQKHAQRWSKICCARVLALFHTVADR